MIGKVKAICFDLDGLLADTEHLHIAAYEKVARELGIKLSREYMHRFIGVATKDNIRKIMNDFHIPPDMYTEVLELRYKSYMDAIKSNRLYPMDGAVRCIVRASVKGFKRALVTSSIEEHALETIRNFLANLSEPDKKEANIYRESRDKAPIRLKDPDPYRLIHEMFDVMVFGDEVKNPKPAPDIYILALKRLKVDSGCCVALEDSESGVLAAKAAGMWVIAVPSHHTKDQDLSHADLVLGSLNEVAELDFMKIF